MLNFSVCRNVAAVLYWQRETGAEMGRRIRNAPSTEPGILVKKRITG